MQNQRKIPFPMSQKLECSWLGASKMASFATLPETTKDVAIAKFLRHRRPDLFDTYFLGDCLVWTLGRPSSGSSPEVRSSETTVDLRMSAHLLAAVSKITASMDYTAAPDPTWAAILKLRRFKADAFDFSILSDGLAFYLASLELQVPPE